MKKLSTFRSMRSLIIVAEKTAKEIKINKMPLSEFLFFARFTKILLDYLLIKVYFSCISYYRFFKIQL